MGLNLNASAPFAHRSLRAERGNPVMTPARSATFEPRTLRDTHWASPPRARFGYDAQYDPTHRNRPS